MNERSNIDLELLRRQNADQADMITTLKGGGGGGTYGGDMEARVARLESDIEHIKNGVSKLESSSLETKAVVNAIHVDLAKGVGEIKAELVKIVERAKHFPTKWEVFGIVSALLVAAIAIFGLGAKIAGG